MPAVAPPETFQVLADGSAIGAVSRHTGLAPEAVARLIAFGSVYWNYRRLEADIAVRAGDYLRVHTRPRRFPVGGIDWRARIVADRPELVVIDKPGGVPMHPTCDNAVENALAQVERALGTKLFVCHRLDAATRGLVVLGRTPEFCARFGGWLAARAIRKRYRAWVARPVPLGEAVHYQLPDERAPRVAVAQSVPGARECRMIVGAVTRVPARDAYALDIELVTGRMHQIRCQLAALGAPILGDALYGSDRPAPDGPETIALACRRLELPEGAGEWELPVLE